MNPDDTVPQTTRFDDKKKWTLVRVVHGPGGKDDDGNIVIPFTQKFYEMTEEYKRSLESTKE